MPEYNYTARTKEGKLVKDKIRMKDEQALADYLKQKNLILTSTHETAREGTFSIKKMVENMGRIPIVEKIFFTQNLSIMVKTGFSLAQALKTIQMQTQNKKLQSVVGEVQRDVENGVTFSNALARHPKDFPELFINMIAAGEASGKLDEILVTLTNQMKKDHGIISKVRSAMMYPSVIVVAMVAIGTIMMITVVPQLLTIFEDAALELPITTRALIFVSNSIQSFGPYIGVGLIILAYALNRLRKTKKGKFYWHLILLKLPMIGSIIKKINLARFTRTLSSLLKTDIPIVQTLQIISKTLGNVHYKSAMLTASEQVKKGITIVKTLETKPNLFPPIVTQMVNVGEESGTLDMITEEIAEFYEEDVDQTMSGLSSVIEPILMLLIGGVVLVLALSVLQPMYGLVDAI